MHELNTEISLSGDSPGKYLADKLRTVVVHVVY